MLHVNIIMLHVDMNKSHVNIDMLHVTIMYLACMGQKNCRRGGLKVEHSPRMREIGVRYPVATDLSRKNRY